MIEKKDRQAMALELLHSDGFKLFDEELERLEAEALKSTPRETLIERVVAYETMLNFKSTLQNELNNA